jgi:hypothetical protein
VQRSNPSRENLRGTRTKKKLTPGSHAPLAPANHEKRDPGGAEHRKKIEMK